MKDPIYERQKGELDEGERDCIAYRKAIETSEKADQIPHENLRLQRIEVLAETIASHSVVDHHRSG